MTNKKNKSGVAPMTVEIEDGAESKVIHFHPRTLKALDIENIEATIESAQQQKRLFVTEVTDFAMDQLVAIFQSFGIFLDSPKIDTRDMVLLEQVLEGIGLRYYRIHHPVHDLIESSIQLSEDAEEVEAIADDQEGDGG